MSLGLVCLVLLRLCMPLGISHEEKTFAKDHLQMAFLGRGLRFCAEDLPAKCPCDRRVHVPL